MFKVIEREICGIARNFSYPSIESKLSKFPPPLFYPG